MADVQFVIEGRLFYAHKIILVNASAKFKTILANSSQLTEGSLPCIEIKDMKYKTFEVSLYTYVIQCTRACFGRANNSRSLPGRSGSIINISE
jgi:hypothetical protein